MSFAHHWHNQMPLVAEARSSGVRCASNLGPPADAAVMCAATPRFTAPLGVSAGPAVWRRHVGLEQRCPARCAKRFFAGEENSVRIVSSAPGPRAGSMKGSAAGMLRLTWSRITCHRGAGWRSPSDSIPRQFTRTSSGGRTSAWLFVRHVLSLRLLGEGGTAAVRLPLAGEGRFLRGGGWGGDRGPEPGARRFARLAAPGLTGGSEIRRDAIPPYGDRRLGCPTRARRWTGTGRVCLAAGASTSTVAECGLGADPRAGAPGGAPGGTPVPRASAAEPRAKARLRPYTRYWDSTRAVESNNPPDPA